MTEKKDERMTPEEYRVQKPIHDRAVHAVLRKLAEREVVFARDRYGSYHSPHEGLAVIDEEVWEAKRAIEMLSSSRNLLRNSVYCDRDFEVTENAAMIEKYAFCLAQEAIHVAATAQRFLQALDAGNGEFANIADETM